MSTRARNLLCELNMSSRGPHTSALNSKVSCFAAEFVGTFMLTFIDAGVGLVSSFSPDQFAVVARALAPGLTVMTAIFALGELSGAHLNPAVTLAFAVRGVFPWKRVIVYWAIQFAAAITAACVLGAMFGFGHDLGGTQPLRGLAPAFGMETILTLFLVLVILSTSHQSKIKGPESAFPVAAVLVVCGLLGKTVSGASMNPARSFGPALANGALSTYWIYLAAPVLGSLLAVALVYLLQGPPKEREREAAEGEKNVRH